MWYFVCNDLPRLHILQIGSKSRSMLPRIYCKLSKFFIKSRNRRSAALQLWLFFKSIKTRQGSRTEKCTVGFMCRGSGGGALTLGRAGAKGACVKDRLVILDGTEGSMTGCGKFSFKDTPRTARNGGTDLYVTYSGISDATCLAFCVQDIKKENTGVKPGASLSQYLLISS